MLGIKEQAVGGEKRIHQAEALLNITLSSHGAALETLLMKNNSGWNAGQPLPAQAIKIAKVLRIGCQQRIHLVRKPFAGAIGSRPGGLLLPGYFVQERQKQTLAGARRYLSFEKVKRDNLMAAVFLEPIQKRLSKAAIVRFKKEDSHCIP